MKYLVNNHTYEGLGGETTDWLDFYDDYAEALDVYKSQKKLCDYQDSFVQLYGVEGKDSKLLRAYYNDRYGERNSYDCDRFRNGEYIRQVATRDEDGDLLYVDYDTLPPYKG